MCLNNFEDVLRKAKVAEIYWVGYLKSVLVGRHADLIHSLKLPEDTYCQMDKELLLEASDCAIFNAGTKLFNPDKELAAK